jgi:exopolysaccharide biosynthesis polyprenyl glycosylphosphotransferase
MRKKSELIFSLLLLPIDFVAIVGAFIVAYAIRVKVDTTPVAHPYGLIFFLKIFLLIAPVWILLFALTGLYNQSALRSRLQELGRIFVAVSAGLMFMVMVNFVSKTPIFPSKAVPVYAYGLSLVTVTLGRLIVRVVQRSLFQHGIGTYKAVVVGSGTLAQQLAISLANTANSGYEISGVIDTAKGAEQRMAPHHVAASWAELRQHLNGRPVDEIIQADSSLGPEAIFELVEYAASHHITYRFIPNQFGIFATHSELGTLAGMPMVAMKRTPLDGWGRIVKRGFDVVSATLGLIVLSPLFLVIAIIIKLTDRGRVLYRHKRLSRTGKVIYVYKFRSMYERFSTGGGFSGKTDLEIFAELGRPDLIEEFEREQKVKQDPRVTPIGAWLRRTSLDELPQLINIWLGDLSLVGPRPIVEAELDKYGTGRATLLALKPGLTGLWQVSGRNDVSYDERVKLDMYYIENWSFWLDLRIILRTIVIVLRGRGAY